MRTKELRSYESPEVAVFVLQQEGALCGSLDTKSVSPEFGAGFNPTEQDWGI